MLKGYEFEVISFRFCYKYKEFVPWSGLYIFVPLPGTFAFLTRESVEGASWFCSNVPLDVVVEECVHTSA